MKGRIDLQKVLLALAAPVIAVIFAALVSSVVLLISGDAPLHVFKVMLDFGTQPQQIVNILNRSTTYYLSAVAVAIGFRMNLFNIGVDGQYRLAAFLAAAVGGNIHLPRPLHVLVIILVAMLVGAMWAGIAGLLRTGRGVSEVISTIMLNFIAFGLIAYLLENYLKKPTNAADLTTATRPIPPSGLFPALLHNPIQNLSSTLILAVVVGVLFYVVVWRTRFGFDLRASGLNPDAARVSGISPNAMVMRTMLLSGAIAGLVGMTELLFNARAYNLDFPADLGFTGIAVALVGRNHPAGAALAALLFAFLNHSALILDLNNIPKEIVQIMTGIIILSVVIAYEVVRRLVQAQETRAAAEKARAMGLDREPVSAA
ncbi:MAG TPA: sugar ABC transporter permease [Actinobacteria bacterium]|nr:sugar ABC transporter permease [Actinomycetota bacterium]